MCNSIPVICLILTCAAAATGYAPPAPVKSTDTPLNQLKPNTPWNHGDSQNRISRMADQSTNHVDDITALEAWDYSKYLPWLIRRYRESVLSQGRNGYATMEMAGQKYLGIPIPNTPETTNIQPTPEQLELQKAHASMYPPVLPAFFASYPQMLSNQGNHPQVTPLLPKFSPLSTSPAPVAVVPAVQFSTNQLPATTAQPILPPLNGNHSAGMIGNAILLNYTKSSVSGADLPSQAEPSTLTSVPDRTNSNQFQTASDIDKDDGDTPASQKHDHSDMSSVKWKAASSKKEDMIYPDVSIKVSFRKKSQ